MRQLRTQYKNDLKNINILLAQAAEKRKAELDKLAAGNAE
jgi:hypothetical protein